MSLAARETTCTPSTRRVVAIEDDLVEAVLRARVLRARDVRQRMLDDADVVALLARLRLGQPDAAQLGIREDRGRQHRVVGAPGAVAEHVLDRDARLVLRDRREHRAGRDVACSPDRRRRSCADDRRPRCRRDRSRGRCGRARAPRCSARGPTRAGRATPSIVRPPIERRDAVAARARTSRRRCRARPRSLLPRARPAARPPPPCLRARRSAGRCSRSSRASRSARRSARTRARPGPRRRRAATPGTSSSSSARDVVDPLDVLDARNRRNRGAAARRDQDPVAAQLLVADADGPCVHERRVPGTTP